jgi:short-chain Z-isoprenyl diphosphate synthase
VTSGEKYSAGATVDLPHAASTSRAGVASSVAVTSMGVDAERSSNRAAPGSRGLVRSTRQAGRVAGAIVLAPLYTVYTHRLRRDVSRRFVPQHVAVILDGNRRWASASGLNEPSAGHQAGADKLDELIDWCARIGIGQVTVWALARENLERTERELASLFGVIADKLDALAVRHAQQSVRIRVLGRHAELPDHVRHSIEAAERMTAANQGLRLNIALGYSGRDELVDAVRGLVRSLVAAGCEPIEIPDRITREALGQHLYTAGEPDPDLIIRTSGEQRLSGFLPWQGIHSELYFTDVYWPAFRELDFLRAIRSFQQRERRFGR